MAVLTREPVVWNREAKQPGDASPARLAPGWPLRRFSLDEYHHLIEIGFFQPEERLELIEGTLRYMSPISPRHAETLSRMIDQFATQLGMKAMVRAQSPITLADESSEPEPDFALVARHPGGYAERHPNAEDIFLLVEVADSSLRYDREVKVPLYAAAGIREYWIVNLIDDSVEIYRQPTVLASGAAGYAEKTIHAGEDQIAPQAFPECTLVAKGIIPGAA